MKDDRLRVSVDSTYLAAIGMAAYCFATMEWNAVYCGEKLSPGYVNTVAEKTAGVIARDIVGFTQLVTEQNKQARYQTATNNFAQLVKRRNDLMHATPGTFESGQRLGRSGIPWELADINNIADDFATCSIELNELYYHVL